MLLRRRLDRIEKAVGVGRCPHCRGLLVRPEAHLTAEECFEQLVQSCQTPLPESNKPGQSLRTPGPAKPMCCPGCKEPLPASVVNALVPSLHEIVAAIIEAERREGKSNTPQPQQYGQQHSSGTCNRM